MFRYYQTDEKSRWKIISDGNNVIDEVLSHGGKKLTVLAVSEEVTDDTVVQDLRYKGPFYADIDVKGDLSLAARSARELLEKLEERGVGKEMIGLFASGSKGFHVLIDEKVFSTGRPLKSLPQVYKEMALALYVQGMDLQVYSGGRGNSWRLPNLERYDGNYRVQITREELNQIVDDYTVYKELVSGPREPVQLTVPETKVTGFEALFNHCKTLAGRTPANRAAVTSEALKAAFSEELPQCVVDLREGKVRKSSNFNHQALNLAVFAARAGRSEGDFNSLASRMAENVDSSTYDTPAKKLSHSEGMYRYVSTSDKYQFSCAAIRSVVNTKPCGECSFNDKGNEEAISEGVGIALSEGCYYRVSPGGNSVMISTFTITPKHKVLGVSEDDGVTPLLKGIMCDVFTSSGDMTQRLMTEASWRSKASFLSSIEGIEGATFFGSDTDIQKLKFFVFNEETQMDEVKEVIQAGIIINDFKGFPLPVYVEPGMSLNKFGTQGTHVLHRDVPTPPHMKDILLGNEQFKEACDSLELLTRINKPEVISLLLGWFAATHLKAHIHHRFKQFPLLNLWGNAGSGKTRTAEMFMGLVGNASDYGSMSLSLPHTTKFPVINYVTSTTTVVRILEEFNRSKLSVRDYSNIHEILKAAYNNHPVSRGTVGGGAQSSQLPNARSLSMNVTAPLLYVSEQPVESPPLRQRSIAIGMDSRGRDSGTEAWTKLEPAHKRLEVIAKLLCLEAIKTSVDDVQDMVESQELDVPGMEHRPKFNLQVCSMGLDWLRQVLVKNNSQESTLSAIDSLKGQMQEGFSEVVADTMTQTSRTEVDLVLEDMALMAYMQGTDTIKDGLQKGVHYFVNGNKLYLDLPVAHGLYLRYKGSGVVIESYSQMVKLIRTETYYVTDKSAAESLGINRRVTELDLDKMASKGIEVSLFE